MTITAEEMRVTVEVVPAVAAGLEAALVTTALRIVARLTGVTALDPSQLWRETVPPMALATPIITGMLLGVAYAWAFHQLAAGWDALWLWGAVGGLVQYLVVGVALGFAPRGIDRRPGMFATNLGWGDAAVLFASQLMFGLIVGAIYGFVAGP